MDKRPSILSKPLSLPFVLQNPWVGAIKKQVIRPTRGVDFYAHLMQGVGACFLFGLHPGMVNYMRNKFGVE